MRKKTDYQKKRAKRTDGDWGYGTDHRRELWVSGEESSCPGRASIKTESGKEVLVFTTPIMTSGAPPEWSTALADYIVSLHNRELRDRRLK